MSFCPSIAFYLADERTPVRPGSSPWYDRLPLRRGDLFGVPTDVPRTDSLCCGDYFLAAANFLCGHGGALLAVAVGELTAKKITPAQIDTISIFLEKHGAFYHPSRVRVCFGEDAATLVLNVAVTEAGRRRLHREFSLIRSLGGGLERHLPRVFTRGVGRTPDGRPLPMFLGEWFDGFFEFHLTGWGNQTVIWDPDTGPRALTADRRRNLYRGVARILAETYTPETGGRVHPWHHGAGDFILRDRKGEHVDLRLITVRGYPSSMPEGSATPQALLRELIVFFLHTSMRTRIDRADGTGQLLWADESAVEPTLIGFAEGMAGRSIPDQSGSVSELFLGVFSELPPDALDALAVEAIGHFGGATEDGQIARRHLNGHLRELAEAANSLSGPLL